MDLQPILERRGQIEVTRSRVHFLECSGNFGGRTGSATKGAKDYHWAMIEITPDDTPGGHFEWTTKASNSNAARIARCHHPQRL
jgi:hypothetical protein